jgi:hypothetical protein
MREEKIYTVSWTQTYNGWVVKDTVEQDKITDLTQAREVLARIMSK